MLTFHGDQELKATVVKRLETHLAKDSLRQNYGYVGAGAANSHVQMYGCALGCTLLDSVEGSHVGAQSIEELYERKNDIEALYDSWGHAVADEYSLPLWLTQVEEAVFEALPMYPQETWREWPLRLVELIPVGADEETMESIRERARALAAAHSMYSDIPDNRGWIGLHVARLLGREVETVSYDEDDAQVVYDSMIQALTEHARDGAVAA